MTLPATAAPSVRLVVTALAALRPLVGLALVGLLAGCPPKAPPELPPLEVDPMELLGRAQAEPAPGPSAATFDLRLVTPEQTVNANGALVVSPPNRFRVEVRGPIGPPQLVIVSDGTAVTAWIAGKNEIVTAADARIRALTGGEVGVEALAALILGRLPGLGQPDFVKPERPPAYRWSGPDQSHLDVTLDTRTAHLSALTLSDAAGKPLLEADVAGQAWPEQLDVRIPSKGVVARLTFDEWRPAQPADAAFTLPVPPGATVRPLELGVSGPAPAGAPEGQPTPDEPPVP